MLSRPSSALHPETIQPSRGSNPEHDDEAAAGSHEGDSPSPPPAQSLPPVALGRGLPPDARIAAAKLAKVGLLLKKQGEPDALVHVQKSLHLDPSASRVWATLAHGLVQDQRPHAALAAFSTTVQLTASAAPDERNGREEVAARAGLATVCAQLGLSGRAANQLIVMRALEQKSSSSAAAWKMMAGPFELLCRRLMPGHRFSAAQQAGRTSAWQQALVESTLPGPTRVFDISTSTFLPALFAARTEVVARPVVRIEHLPMGVSERVLEDNGLHRRSPPRPPSAVPPVTPSPRVRSTRARGESFFASLEQRESALSATQPAAPTAPLLYAKLEAEHHAPPVQLVATTSDNGGSSSLPPNPEEWCLVDGRKVCDP